MSEEEKQRICLNKGIVLACCFAVLLCFGEVARNGLV